MRKILKSSALIFSALSLFGAQCRAEGSSSASHTFEVYPFFGSLLPSDILGLENSVQGLGVRGDYLIASPTSLEVGSYFWKHEGDSGHTFEAGISYELPEDIKPYFSAGVHYSKFHIGVKRDSLGECPGGDCDTDTGTHFGVYGGGGMIFPISQVLPVKAGLRFYKGPAFWVLIDIGVAFRF